MNTTLGIGGLFDPASGAHLPLHEEDFGQTFARWGVGSGPLSRIPFLGPSDVRDGIGFGGRLRRTADALSSSRTNERATR